MLGGVIFEALTGGDAIDDVEQPGRHYRHELPALAIARFTDDPRVEGVNTLLRLMFRREPGERCSAATVVDLCDQLLAWSPGGAEPHFPMSNASDDAAARFHARRRTAENESIQNELRAVCDSVVGSCNLTKGAPAGQVSRTIETNSGDYEPFNYIRGKFPDAVWMAVRAKVDFDVPPVRIVPMSYVFIGRLGPDRELVGTYNEDKEWKILSDGRPGAPGHRDLMVKAALEELARLDKEVAAKIDKLI